MSDRESIIGAEDRKFGTVSVPEWSERPFRLRTITASDFWRLKKVSDDAGKWTHLLCVMSLVDGNGERLFADDEVDILAGKSPDGVFKVAAAAMKLSSLGPRDVEEAGKNSEPTQSVASS